MKTGIAQSFFESPIHRNTSPARSGASPDDKLVRKDACHCTCRCGRARERKVDGARGKRRSRSYSPLRTSVAELSGWTDEALLFDGVAEQKHETAPGEAPLERLPVEILGGWFKALRTWSTADIRSDRIISQLALDIPPAEYTPRNEDLVHCLLTSRTMHVATLNTLYSHITIPHSKIFSKFLNQVSQNPDLGKLVRRLDLSHFTPVGMGRTQQDRQNLQHLTSETLLRCLELTPNIQEVLLQEHVEEQLDRNVLRKLFTGLPNLRGVDFCAAYSSKFVDFFSAAVEDLVSRGPSMLGIRKLGLHECFTLKSSSLEQLLPLLPRLTHLDLSHTRVSDKALMSIPKTASLTHLSLSRCSQITGPGTVDFITSHPAASGLVYLNLSCDTSRYRLLWESDVDRLLPDLPATLRSLNLGGAQIRSTHTRLLLPLTKHLEELGIGFTDLSMKDVSSLFMPKSLPDSTEAMSEEEANWVPSTVSYLDLTGIPAITQPSMVGNACNLLSSITYPLEVIELGSTVIKALGDCGKTNKRLGWLVKELGRRGWYVREPAENGPTGSGRRSWKMGAMWWGMRKIPVAYGDVGGLYGHYMFKK